MTSHPRGPGLTRRRMIQAALATTLAVPGAAALAAAPEADFPNRPMRMILPFPPGSGTDIGARYFARHLSEITGQSVVVENRPGGHGFIAINAVLNAPADGYTMFVGGTSSYSTNVILFKSLPYDPVRDFSVIAMLSRGPAVLAVGADSPFKDLADLVAQAKARPNSLNGGTGAVSYQLAAAMFYEMAGIQVTNVPFKGASDATAAAASGVVDLAVVDIGSALPLVSAGKLRVLAVSSDRRSPHLAAVPTFVEAGYPEYTTFNWSGAAVSSRTPPAIVARLDQLFQQISELPETEAYFSRTGNERVLGGAANMRQQQLLEIERWKRIASIAGIQPMDN